MVDLGRPGVLDDFGDIDTDGDVRASIESAITEIISEGGRPISLGGDHSITYPILRAVRAKHRHLTILHLDAHADLYDEFEGDRYSHACPFARIMEENLTDRLVQVGVRTLTGHQLDQVTRFGVEVIDMRAWSRGARPEISGGPVYLSLDLDVLDPAFAPGVSHWEPGGLSVREVIDLIHHIDGPLIGADDRLSCCRENFRSSNSLCVMRAKWSRGPRSYSMCGTSTSTPRQTLSTCMSAGFAAKSIARRATR